MDNKSERYQKGIEKILEVDGQAGLDAVMKVGDLGQYILEFAFGDIYNREALSLRDRELITIAVLTVLARLPQLGTHIHAGYNVGLSDEEIEEAIIQTVPFAGFPSAINAIGVLKKVRREMKQEAEEK